MACSNLLPVPEDKNGIPQQSKSCSINSTSKFSKTFLTAFSTAGQTLFTQPLKYKSLAFPFKDFLLKGLERALATLTKFEKTNFDCKKEMNLFFVVLLKYSHFAAAKISHTSIEDGQKSLHLPHFKQRSRYLFIF